jgi:hypothetical protein
MLKVTSGAAWLKVRSAAMHAPERLSGFRSFMIVCDVGVEIGITERMGVLG